MSEKFPPTVDDFLETFDLLEEWEERYEYLVEVGRKLPALDGQFKTEQNIVKGCMSSVWITIDTSDPNHFQFQADSDSLIVRGLIVVLYAFFEGKSCQEVSVADPSSLFQTLGFDNQLSSNRRNGLASIVKRIRSEAIQAVAS